MKQLDATPLTMKELANSILSSIEGSSKFHHFQRLYRSDRIAFVYDIMPAVAKTITPYQLEVLGYYDQGYNRVAVRGPHGLGKTFLASILTHHAVLTCESDGKVITTASAWRQLEHYLWPEIHKLSKVIYWTETGRNPYENTELFNLAIKMGGVVEAFAAASDDYNTIEGAHATRLTYIFDEAKAIPVGTWDAAEGAFSNAGLRVRELSEEQYEYDGVLESTEISDQESVSSIGGNKESIVSDNSTEGNVDSISSVYSLTHHHPLAESIIKTTSPEIAGLSINPYITREPIIAIAKQPIIKKNIDSNLYLALAFAISTPGEPSGRFYDIHMKRPGYEDWITRHVTLDEAILAGRISPDWVEQREKQWGIDSAIFQNRVLGEFADTSEEGVIPLSWVRAAVNRWKDKKSSNSLMPDGKFVIGVDVARSGDDSTVLAERYAAVVSAVHYIRKTSLTSIAGKIVILANSRFPYINIEMDGGLGAGVYDILHQDSVPNLRPITVSGATAFRDRSKEMRFLNVRAAMWWNLRELLDPQYGSGICLPPDDKLRLDLITPRWSVERGGVVQLESKVSIRARIGRSTDAGDAVCLAFWNQSSGGGVVV